MEKLKKYPFFILLHWLPFLITSFLCIFSLKNSFFYIVKEKADSDTAIVVLITVIIAELGAAIAFPKLIKELKEEYIRSKNYKKYMIRIATIIVLEISIVLFTFSVTMIYGIFLYIFTIIFFSLFFLD